MSQVTRIIQQQHSAAYPLNHVIGIMPTGRDAITAFDSLGSGRELADRIRATTGRSGLLGRILDILDRFGAGGDEMDDRHEYEQALRDGGVTVLVLAPTEERKLRAAEILRLHGGHFINFFGKLKIEQL
jgi:hypothetical protein